MQKNNYSKIRNIKDLQKRKRLLKRKVKIYELRLKRRLLITKNAATPSFLYEQAIKSVNMENSMLSLFPFIAKVTQPLFNKIKEKVPFKKVLPVAGAIIAGIVGYVVYKKYKARKNKTT